MGIELKTKAQQQTHNLGDNVGNIKQDISDVPKMSDIQVQLAGSVKQNIIQIQPADSVQQNINIQENNDNKGIVDNIDIERKAENERSKLVKAGGVFNFIKALFINLLLFPASEIERILFKSNNIGVIRRALLIFVVDGCDIQTAFNFVEKYKTNITAIINFFIHTSLTKPIVQWMIPEDFKDVTVAIFTKLAESKDDNLSSVIVGVLPNFLALIGSPEHDSKKREKAMKDFLHSIMSNGTNVKNFIEVLKLMEGIILPPGVTQQTNSMSIEFVKNAASMARIVFEQISQEQNKEHVSVIINDLSALIVSKDLKSYETLLCWQRVAQNIRGLLNDDQYNNLCKCAANVIQHVQEKNILNLIPKELQSLSILKTIMKFRTQCNQDHVKYIMDLIGGIIQDSNYGTVYDLMYNAMTKINEPGSWMGQFVQGNIESIVGDIKLAINAKKDPPDDKGEDKKEVKREDLQNILKTNELLKEIHFDPKILNLITPILKIQNGMEYVINIFDGLKSNNIEKLCDGVIKILEDKSVRGMLMDRGASGVNNEVVEFVVQCVVPSILSNVVGIDLGKNECDYRNSAMVNGDSIKLLVQKVLSDNCSIIISACKRIQSKSQMKKLNEKKEDEDLRKELNMIKRSKLLQNSAERKRMEENQSNIIEMSKIINIVKKAIISDREEKTLAAQKENSDIDDKNIDIGKNTDIKSNTDAISFEEFSDAFERLSQYHLEWQKYSEKEVTDLWVLLIGQGIETHMRHEVTSGMLNEEWVNATLRNIIIALDKAPKLSSVIDTISKLQQGKCTKIDVMHELYNDHYYLVKDLIGLIMNESTLNTLGYFNVSGYLGSAAKIVGTISLVQTILSVAINKDLKSVLLPEAVNVIDRMKAIKPVDINNDDYMSCVRALCTTGKMSPDDCSKFMSKMFGAIGYDMHAMYIIIHGVTRNGEDLQNLQYLISIFQIKNCDIFFKSMQKYIDFNLKLTEKDVNVNKEGREDAIMNDIQNTLKNFDKSDLSEKIVQVDAKIFNMKIKSNVEREFYDVYELLSTTKQVKNQSDCINIISGLKPFCDRHAEDDDRSLKDYLSDANQDRIDSLIELFQMDNYKCFIDSLPNARIGDMALFEESLDIYQKITKDKESSLSLETYSKVVAILQKIYISDNLVKYFLLCATDESIKNIALAVDVQNGKDFVKQILNSKLSPEKQNEILSKDVRETINKYQKRLKYGFIDILASNVAKKFNMNEDSVVQMFRVDVDITIPEKFMQHEKRDDIQKIKDNIFAKILTNKISQKINNEQNIEQKDMMKIDVGFNHLMGSEDIMQQCNKEYEFMLSVAENLSNFMQKSDKSENVNQCFNGILRAFVENNEFDKIYIATANCINKQQHQGKQQCGGKFSSNIEKKNVNSLPKLIASNFIDQLSTAQNNKNGNYIANGFRSLYNYGKNKIFGCGIDLTPNNINLICECINSASENIGLQQNQNVVGGGVSTFS